MLRANPADMRNHRTFSRTGLTFVALFAVLLGACSESTKPPVQPKPIKDAPSLTCGGEVRVQSPNGLPVAVTYEVPVTVGGEPPVPVTCSPLPGAMFGVGSTPVTCKTTDALGRSAQCSLVVTVVAPPRLTKTRYLAFGDSMTDGVVSLGGPTYMLLATPQSYPTKLDALLRARYATQTCSVLNAGKPGERAMDGIERLEDVIRDNNPEVVLLMEGANDLLARQEAGISTVVNAMDGQLDVSRRANLPAFLATLPPQRASGIRGFAASAVAPLNDRLRDLAARRGAILVDVWAAFGGQPDPLLVGSDGLHLTEAGYEKVAQTFFEAIKTAFEEKPPSTPAFRVR